MSPQNQVVLPVAEGMLILRTRGLPCRTPPQPACQRIAVSPNSVCSGFTEHMREFPGGGWHAEQHSPPQSGQNSGRRCSVHTRRRLMCISADEKAGLAKMTASLLGTYGVRLSTFSCVRGCGSPNPSHSSSRSTTFRVSAVSSTSVGPSRCHLVSQALGRAGTHATRSHYGHPGIGNSDTCHRICSLPGAFPVSTTRPPSIAALLAGTSQTAELGGRPTRTATRRHGVAS